MKSNEFFKEQRETSHVKARIITKYFFAWAKVIVQTQKKHNGSDRIGYIDLFAGPGRYEDGNISTPCMILSEALKDKDIRDRLVAVFNDKDEANTKSLKKAIDNIPGIELLKHYPKISNAEVGEEIVSDFEQMKLIPSFLFVDPWGYKGLSLRLVHSVLKDWGCDCVFFFNYNRINMGIANPYLNEPMNLLFGTERADKLRGKIINLSTEDRELMIIEEICQALKEYGYKYVLPFRFKNCEMNRTSHHLVFVSKSFRGYEIMKEIMWKESSQCDDDGIGSFEYNPADNLPKQSLLFMLSRPLEDLKDLLLEDFKGKTLTMEEIYEQHSVDKPYIKRNYKAALKELESEKKISSAPHKKNTFGDNVLVKFPK